MSVKVYGINHIAIDVNDVEKAVAFYQDVFDLEKLDEGEGDAFFKIGEHQFLAMFEAPQGAPNRTRHFGLIVRDEAQLAEVREKLTGKRDQTDSAVSLRLRRSVRQSRAGRRFARRVAGLATPVQGGSRRVRAAGPCRRAIRECAAERADSAIVPAAGEERARSGYSARAR